MSDEGQFARWSPPGPVAARFMHSAAPVKCICGPVGSGKTITAMVHLVLRAAMQEPGADGIRRFKFAVVRDTYRQLEKTTIPSWLRWFPRHMGEFTGGEGGRPAIHRLPVRLFGRDLEVIVEFIGLGENKIEDSMRGWEGTAVYLNEADLLAEETLTYVLGRIGRYPPKEFDGSGGATWYGVVMDCNAPDTENWLYKRFIENLPEGWEWHHQPSGLSPDAENVKNLPDGYYQRQMEGQPEWYVRRMVRAEFGYSREGKPVYPEFSDRLHVAPAPLVPARGVGLTIGADAGLTPGLTVWQRMPDGQWRCLDELAVAISASVGPNRFAEMLNRLLAEERYRIWERSMERGRRAAIAGWADPSAAYGADKEGGELSWIEAFSHRCEIAFRPAPTQQLSARIEAVRVPLTRLIDGDTPGLLISPACKVLRKGFNSGYRFRRVQLAGSERYEDKPEKNEWSHVHDSAQYALSGGGELAEVTGRRERRERAIAAQRATAQQEYDPLRW